MSIDFIYDKLGMLMSVLGLILTLLLFSNAYMKKLFYVVNDTKINNIKINKPNKTYLFLKRLFDLIFASLSLLLLFPVFIITYVLVKLFIQGSVIKKISITDMLTKHNYYLYVFRTFEDVSKTNPNSIDNKQIKIGRLGRFLRMYSLDELPKLINIIKGDISFVGRYTYKFYDEYLDTIPLSHIDILKEYPIGMISLWIITLHSPNIRFEYSEIFKYDLLYTSKASLLFDIYILFKTAFLFLGSKAAK